jgi:hypothetical protein
VGDPDVAMGTRQQGDHLTPADDQGHPQCGKRLAQLNQSLAAEGPLPGRGILLLPELRLHHIQRQNRSAARRLKQGCMVNDPQIPLEPDDLHRAHD